MNWEHTLEVLLSLLPSACYGVVRACIVQLAEVCAGAAAYVEVWH